MYNFYKSAKRTLPFLFWIPLSSLLISCIPKPASSSAVDGMIFANYVFQSQTPIPLKIRVQGLAAGASFQISNQDSETLWIDRNGDFEFAAKKAKYSPFTVNVDVQPVTTPSQICVITNPNGILDPNSNLVEINCGTRFYDVKLNVFGISNSATGALRVRNGSVDTLAVTADGTHTFSAQVPDLGNYSVTILSHPNKHRCTLEPLPPASGTINGGPVTLNVNCLSLLSSVPADQTVLTPNDTIRFTFSKSVEPWSCSFTVPTPVPPAGACSADLSGSADPIAAADYSGDTVTVRPNPSWPTGLNQCIQLSGCREAVTNRPFRITSPTRFSVGAQIKYVTAGGVAAGTCDTVANACSGIQYAVSQCNTVSPCFVMVSGGIYPVNAISDRVLLIDKLQLLGGFSSDFQNRDIDAYQTVIRDDLGAGGCGSSEVTSCAAIAGGTITVNSNIIIQGFTIVTNPFNPWSTGIWLDNINTGANSLIIDKNRILGSTNSISPYGLFIVRSGIYVSNIRPNLVLTENYIVGGSGNSQSVGIRILNNTEGVLNKNWISGASHVNLNDGLDFSLAISINNPAVNTTQSLKIINNVLNGYHETAATPVSAVSSAGIQALAINSSNFILIHNTIFGGEGTSRSFGIHHQAVGNLNVILLNNQIVSNPLATSRICAKYDVNPVNNLSNINGNNFFGCSVPVETSTNSFRVCGPEPGILREAFGCTTLLTNVSDANFNHDPIFRAATNDQDVFRLDQNSKCNSVYGGFDPGYPPPIPLLYQFDLLGNARSQNSSASVPAGSFGYSIGAMEFDGVCDP
ncbi:hypothetical protein CH375_03535 [Leptospira ellisii]|uniref:Right-handed parallel beta-helix repeat-containing protein n=2 Tax=Leptospira ellisii TaxID=2023197 RepID=A0A2N0BP29_9LEPT|nr:hypothetical protein CH379_05195 [Leptospira ellisii]PKA05731.1 hypothetical protein CH375_03535 [Leptospira ellisii]